MLKDRRQAGLHRRRGRLHGLRKHREKRISVTTQFLISNALMILAFIIGSIAVSSNYAGILRGEVSMQAMQELKKSADLFETRLTELDNCAYSIAQTGSVTSVSRARQLSISEYAMLYQLDQDVRSNYQSNGLIDDMLLWFPRSGSLWMEAGFLDAALLEAASRDYRINGLSPNDYFTREFPAAQTHALTMAQLMMAGQERTQLMYPVSLSPLSNFRTEGSVCILLDMEQALQYLSFPQYEGAGARFRIVLRDGTQIYPLAEDDGAFFPQEVPQGEQITYGRDQILFSYEAGKDGRCYQLALPAAYLNTLALDSQKPSLMVTIAVIALAAVLAWVLARHNARPVLHLAELAHVDSSGGNEFQALNASLSQMLQDRSRMEAELKSYQALQRNMVFAKLLSYGFRSEEKVLEALSEAEIMPDGAWYGTAYLHFTSPEALEGSGAHLVLTTVFGRVVPGLMHVYPMSSSSYALIYALRSPEDQPALNRQLGAALSEIRQQYQLIVTLVAGPCASSLLALPDALQQARRAYYAMDQAGQGKVIQAAEQAAWQESVWHLPDALRHRLISLCQAGDYDMLEKVLRQFFDEQVQHYAPGRQDTAQLAYDLRSLFIQLQQQTAGISMDALARTVNSLPNHEDWHQLMEEALNIFGMLCRQITAYRENSAHRLYEDIRQYIRAHFHEPDLSLASIADAFNMNDKYLSQFYKREGHVNLASDIEELRLNQAIALMQQDEATLADICTACGYASLNSFYKAFRRVYGVSPSAYRQNMKPS